MKRVFVIVLTAIIAVCVHSHGPDRDEAAIPPKVLATVEVLHKDMLHMLHSGSWDAEKIAKDLQNAADVIQPKVFSFQKQFKNLKTDIEALEEDNVESQTIKHTVMSWFHFIESVYPGTRKALHPNGGPGMNVPPPRSTTTESAST